MADYLELSNYNFEILENNHNIDCCCVYCFSKFFSIDILEYITEPNSKKTAICPNCGIDSVIPYASKYTEDNFKTWHIHGFGIFTISNSKGKISSL